MRNVRILKEELLLQKLEAYTPYFVTKPLPEDAALSENVKKYIERWKSRVEREMDFELDELRNLLNLVGYNPNTALTTIAGFIEKFRALKAKLEPINKEILASTSEITIASNGNLVEDYYNAREKLDHFLGQNKIDSAL